MIALLIASPWRTAAIALAFVVAWQSLSLTAAKAQRDAARADLGAAQAHEQATARQWSAHSDAIKAELQACQDQWADAVEMMDAALQQSREAERKAHEALRLYEEKFRARSAHCGAALIDAEKACPELGDY